MFKIQIHTFKYYFDLCSTTDETTSTLFIFMFKVKLDPELEKKSQNKCLFQSNTTGPISRHRQEFTLVSCDVGA